VDSCSILPNNFPYKSFVDLNHRFMSHNHYDLKRCLLVDDSELNQSYNPENCYRVLPWQINKSNSIDGLETSLKDHELIILMANLRQWSDLIIHEGQTASDLLKQHYQKTQFYSPANNTYLHPPTQLPLLFTEMHNTHT
jgi:hypothetical protein